MNSSQLKQIEPLVSAALYDFGDAFIKTDSGRTATIPRREVMALASGVACMATLLELEPPKPVEDMTIGDIRNIAHEIIIAHARTLERFDELFDKESDAAQPIETEVSDD